MDVISVTENVQEKYNQSLVKNKKKWIILFIYFSSF